MKKVLIIAVVTAIIIGIVVLLNSCQTESNGSTGNIVYETNVKTKITQMTTTEKFLEYIEITVTDNEYIFNNRKSSIVEIISLANEETVIRITDSNATYNAMSGLLSELIENNISYIIKDN